MSLRLVLMKRALERARLSAALPSVAHRGLASDHGHHHPAKPGDGSARGVHAPDYHDPSELTNTPVPMDYIPGSDTYAYQNPYPQLNKGRLDWLFGEGWRRPPTKEEGQRMRSEWIPFGFNVYDEYEDWRRFHMLAFLLTGFFTLSVGTYWLMPVDWPKMREWARREAFLEIERRRRAGLPLISKDFVDPAQIKLPSDEELGNFDIII